MTATRGRPEPTVVHVHGIAEQSPTKTPRSVAAYRVLGMSGSRTRSFTGMFGRSLAPGVEQLVVEQLRSVQVFPLSIVLKMWPRGSLIEMQKGSVPTKEKEEKAT